MQDKPVMLLATCGGEPETNLDLIEEAFRREVDYVKARLVGRYGLGNCTTPAELGARADATAAAMGADLSRLAEEFKGKAHARPPL